MTRSDFIVRLEKIEADLRELYLEADFFELYTEDESCAAQEVEKGVRTAVASLDYALQTNERN